MIPGSRNPMWGEEFNFSVDELPVKVFYIHVQRVENPRKCRVEAVVSLFAWVSD